MPSKSSRTGKLEPTLNVNAPSKSNPNSFCMLITLPFSLITVYFKHMIQITDSPTSQLAMIKVTKVAYHHIQWNRDFHSAIWWWETFVDNCNGISFLQLTRQIVPTANVFTDACGIFLLTHCRFMISLCHIAVVNNCNQSHCPGPRHLPRALPCHVPAPNVKLNSLCLGCEA